MNSGWRRALVGVGLAIAGVLLTGCHAEGTFDVLSDERVAVDLTISGANLSCPHGADELKLVVTTTVDEFGDQVCHVTGETQATYFSPFGIDITPAAEYLVMQTNLAGGRDSWPTADIQIRFPGKVVDANLGVVEGNSVRITDLGALTQGSGLRVIGVRTAGPPAWVVPALAGAGAGALLVLLVGAGVWLLRRPARRGTLDPADVNWPPPVEADGVFPATDPPAPGTANGVARKPPDPAPGSGPPDAADTSWFAKPPPPTSAPGAQEPAGAPDAGHDEQPHAAWARPEDH